MTFVQDVIGEAELAAWLTADIGPQVRASARTSGSTCPPTSDHYGQ